MGTIDLHGFSVPEAMEAFVRYYNREVRHTAPERIKVIHGYGASGSGGAIRAELRSLLERNQDKLTFVGGENIDGNPGYTVVYPGQSYSRLSTSEGAIYMGDQLSEEILQYCRQVRTEEKIAGKFRRYGMPEVKKTLKALEGQGKVRVVW